MHYRYIDIVTIVFHVQNVIRISYQRNHKVSYSIIYSVRTWYRVIQVFPMHHKNDHCVTRYTVTSLVFEKRKKSKENDYVKWSGVFNSKVVKINRMHVNRKINNFNSAW